MSNKKIGEMAEAVFQLKALREGFIVSRPYGDSSTYDFIIDNGKELKKIQVKSTVSKNQGRNCYKIMSCHSATTKKNYSDGDMDYMACYVHDLGVWWIIPWKAIEGRRTISLPAGEGIMSPYKEAWYLLKDKTNAG